MRDLMANGIVKHKVRMTDLVQAEMLKRKRTFFKKQLFLCTLIPIVMAYIMIPVKYTELTALNWWYVLFLPFLFTFGAATLIQSEKRYNYHGLFGIVEDKKKIWYAKIITILIEMMAGMILYTLFFLVLIAIRGQTITIAQLLIAQGLLFLTYAWEVPLFLLMALKTNVFLPIATSAICSMILSCVFAIKEKLWMIPIAIPTRIMTPVTGILPNGLDVQPGDPIANSNVILPGVIICVVLFVVLTVISAQIFDRQQA